MKLLKLFISFKNTKLKLNGTFRIWSYENTHPRKIKNHISLTSMLDSGGK